MSSDKRHIKRHRKRLQIKYGVEEASRLGYTDDLSDTGLFIQAAIIQRPNTVLKLELTTPAGEVVALTGRVMWAKRIHPSLVRRLKGGMGIRLMSFQSGEESYRGLCADRLAHSV